MSSIFDDVKEFHEKFGMPAKETPGFPSMERERFREKLVIEEYDEWCAASDLELTADAIIDLIYVLIGQGLEYGLPMQELWDEVHAANMRKEGGGLREDGKVLKPEGWVGPDIAGVLERKQ